MRANRHSHRLVLIRVPVACPADKKSRLLVEEGRKRFNDRGRGPSGIRRDLEPWSLFGRCDVFMDGPSIAVHEAWRGPTGKGRLRR